MKGGGLMTTSPAPHAGRLVVITGVTKGLGRALALEMATRGHVVAGCGRNEELLASLRSQIGSKHLLKVVDVALDDNVNEFAKVVLETHGVPDIVVNNAGIINKNAKLWEIPKEEFDAVIDTNVKGTANCIRHFAKHMIQRGQGVIVNVSSGWGRAGAAEVSAYCTSKWAVEGLTRSLAKELPKGMAAVALSPGVLNTELLTSCFGASAALYPSPESWAPQAAEMILGFGVADNGTSQTV
ncbi:unnamed protein product [Sphagnum troendelagicum]|uniref:Ketoreductase domain-containing protein n=1 Tax=Sphagnum troendelagicum TaxID=128251 RepID=A0ABP0TPR4_9BRYO